MIANEEDEMTTILAIIGLVVILAVALIVGFMAGIHFWTNCLTAAAIIEGVDIKPVLESAQKADPGKVVELMFRKK